MITKTFICLAGHPGQTDSVAGPKDEETDPVYQDTVRQQVAGLPEGQPVPRGSPWPSPWCAGRPELTLEDSEWLWYSRLKYKQLARCQEEAFN